MSKIQNPEYTPNAPTCEGRILDPVDDEVVNQGVAFDIGTLLSRRSIVGIFETGMGALALSACSCNGTGSTATRSATPGSTPTASILAEIPRPDRRTVPRRWFQLRGCSFRPP
jgi:hypothetical protein